MAPQKIHAVLTLPGDDFKRLKVHSHARRVSWFYCGDSYLEHRRIAETLGEGFVCRNSLEDLFATARRLAPDYMHWVDDLSRTQTNNPDWWFGAISSRNQEQTCLLRRLCEIRMLQEAWGKVEDEVCLIVVPSPGMMSVVSDWLRAQGVSVEARHPWKNRIQSFRGGIDQLIRWMLFAGASLFRAAAAGLVYRNKSRNVNADIFLGTVLHDQGIREDGTFQDRYFLQLREFLAANGKTVAVFPFMYHFGFSYASILKRLRKSEVPVLLPEDGLTLTDYVWALMYPLRCLYRRAPQALFSGMDVQALIAEECRGEAFLVGIYPALIYRWARRLAKRGVRISRALLWYENRIEDKALVMGLREAFPKADIMGAQLFLYMPLWLSLRPTEAEREAGMVPQIFLEPSHRQCCQLEEFLPGAASRVVPALRYAHLYQDWSLQPASTQKRPAVLLVALSFRTAMAVETLDMLAEAVAQLKEQVRVIVRPHPDLQMQELERFKGRTVWPSFEIDRAPLEKSFQQIDMLVASTSSIVVEAAVRGVPVVFVHGESLLDTDPLAGMGLKGVEDCYSPLQIAQAITRYAGLDAACKDMLRSEGLRLRDTFFTPVNRTTMEAFLSV